MIARTETGVLLQAESFRINLRNAQKSRQVYEESLDKSCRSLKRRKEQKDLKNRPTRPTKIGRYKKKSNNSRADQHRTIRGQTSSRLRRDLSKR